MIDLPLILVSGFLGSAHCVGMCGPFAAILGSAAGGWRKNIWWQGSYSLGRLFTYTFLGACAAYGGQRLLGLRIAGVNATSLLAFAAGGLLIYEGSVAAGLLRRQRGPTTTGVCHAGGLLRSMLQQPGQGGVFLAGVATGFLPCGLVYAFLFLAARSGHLLSGSAIMALFGLGTVPIMVASGFSPHFLPMAWRRHLFTAAGWCVIVMGALSIYRGWAFLFVTDPAACPLCVLDAAIH